VIRPTTERVAVCAGMDKCRLPKKIITYRNKVRKKTGTLEYKVELHLKLFQALFRIT